MTLGEELAKREERCIYIYMRRYILDIDKEIERYKERFTRFSVREWF
jgi:hypothetical protein